MNEKIKPFAVKIVFLEDNDVGVTDDGGGDVSVVVSGPCAGDTAI